MIDCTNADIRDRLPDLLHERLDAAARAAVMAHVERCAACQAELALLRALRGELSRAPALDVSAVGRVVVSRTTAANSREPRAEGDARRFEPHDAAVRPLDPAPRQRRWADWRIAAAIAVLALGSASAAKLLRSRSSAITPDSAVAVVATPVTQTPATTGASGASGASTSVRADVPPVAARMQSTELSMGGGVSDLSDQDLRALLEEIQGLDALPDVEPEPVTVRVAPLTPGSAE